MSTDVDFVNETQLINIPPCTSNTNFDFNVSLINDDLVEGNETLTLSVQPVDPLAISAFSSSTSTITILDDESEVLANTNEPMS